MKKVLILLFIGSLFTSCNSNPQGTGDEIIMEKEHRDNPIEYQTKAIEAAPQPATADSTQVKPVSDTAK